MSVFLDPDVWTAERNQSRTSHFFDKSLFPWHSVLEDEGNFRAIEAEFNQVLKAEKDRIYASGPGGWPGTKIGLIRYGVKEPSNCARFPRTMAILAQIPLVRAAFQGLAPARRLELHNNVINPNFLKCHLGVSIPPEGSSLWVAGEERHLEQRKTLFWDATVTHTAINYSQEGWRTALILEFPKPSLPLGLTAQDACIQWWWHVFSLLNTEFKLEQEESQWQGWPWKSLRLPDRPLANVLPDYDALSAPMDGLPPGLPPYVVRAVQRQFKGWIVL